MNYPLAIFAPQIGSRSETFIRRHMCDLLPEQSLCPNIVTVRTPGTGGQLPNLGREGDSADTAPATGC